MLLACSVVVDVEWVEGSDGGAAVGVVGMPLVVSGLCVDGSFESEIVGVQVRVIAHVVVGGIVWVVWEMSSCCCAIAG